jgi:hypothetical protein
MIGGGAVGSVNRGPLVRAKVPIPIPRGALVGSLALTACGSSPTTTPPASTRPPSTTSSAAVTRQLTYQPFSAQGTIDPKLRVSKTVNGTCQAAGVAGNSSYRCFARASGNNIYDPCFAPPRALNGPLLCPSVNPANSNVVQFDVGSLPSALHGAPEERPWAVRLSNGQVCVLVNAAWGGLGPVGNTGFTGRLPRAGAGCTVVDHRLSKPGERFESIHQLPGRHSLVMSGWSTCTGPGLGLELAAMVITTGDRMSHSRR